jgi:hypothetical protein
MLGDDGDQLPRAPHNVEVALQAGLGDTWVLEVVDQAVGVLEQLTMVMWSPSGTSPASQRPTESPRPGHDSDRTHNC